MVAGSRARGGDHLGLLHCKAGRQHLLAGPSRFGAEAPSTLANVGAGSHQRPEPRTPAGISLLGQSPDIILGIEPGSPPVDPATPPQRRWLKNNQVRPVGSSPRFVGHGISPCMWRVASQKP